MSQGERADWTQGVEGIEIVEGGDPLKAEYLYWVGCAGSFDDKNKKVTQSMAKLMQRAVDFAILGPSEACTGDSARRSGNEYLFQMLATQNVETLNSMGVKKIVTQCPHCFNTLANEYPQLGGHYEVVHHSQFLEWLVDQGASTSPTLSSTSVSSTTTPATSAATTTSTWRRARCWVARRDPALSRPSATAPRACAAAPVVLACGWRKTSATRSTTSGPRSWWRPAPTGSRRLPVLYVMMDDGVKAAGKEEDEVRVADIAITVLEAIETGEAKSQAASLASQTELASLSLQRPSTMAASPPRTDPHRR